MPDPVTGVLVAGSVGSAAIGANAAKKSSKSALQAAQNETELQRAIYEDTSGKLEPFYDSGQDAWSALMYEMGLGEQPEGYGGYTMSPMAKYLMEEGTDSINARFGARGGYEGGAAMEALEANRRRVIGADTDRYFDRLLNTAGMGFDAASGQGSAGRYYASAAGSAGRFGADAAGRGYMGQAQALQTGIGDMAGIYGYFSRQNNPMMAYAMPTMTGHSTSMQGYR